MLITNSKLLDTPVVSISSGQLGYVANSIVDPNSFKIIAFRLDGPHFNKNDPNILDISSIRDYSPNIGFVIDNVEDLVARDDIIKIKKIIELNFDLNGLKVETKKHSKIGTVIDYTVNSEDYMVQQIIVKRPVVKSFVDPEVTIPRQEIIEVTDYKIIIKDELKTIKERAEKEDFIPNFVNPFRKSEQDFAPADNQTPAGKDN